MKELWIGNAVDIEDNNGIGEKGIKYLSKANLPKAEIIDISYQQVSDLIQRLVTKHSNIFKKATCNNWRQFTALFLPKCRE